MINISSLNKGLVAHFRLASDLQKVGSEGITDSDNQNFADGTINEWIVWQTGGAGGTCAYDAGPGGEKTAKITVGATNPGYTGGALQTTQITAFVEGRSYIISADVYIPSSNNNWTRIFAEVGSMTWTTVLANDADLTLEDGWQRVSWIATALADVTGYIKIEGNSTTPGDVFYIDNVSAKPLLIADLTPNGNHPQNFGVTLDQADHKGVANGAGLANGSSDYLLIPDSNVLSFGDSLSDKPFSISAWVNMTDSITFPIFSKGIAATREYYFGTSSARNIVFGLYDNGGATPSLVRFSDSSMASYEGSWVHIIGTYDGTSVVGGIILYANGILESSNDQSSGVYVAMHNLGDAVMFRGYSDGSSYADGSIEEVKIWNRVLTPAEALAEYNSYKSNLVVS
ncbi:MAG: hypothetical protein HOG49_00760 [Candidatus Scalindua sp.]|jgi:hypothetical protein|nr:hypothetical protein [Candidatus Scalindua sp.]